MQSGPGKTRLIYVCTFMWVFYLGTLIDRNQDSNRFQQPLLLGYSSYQSALSHEQFGQRDHVPCATVELN